MTKELSNERIGPERIGLLNEQWGDKLPNGWYSTDYLFRWIRVGFSCLRPSYNGDVEIVVFAGTSRGDANILWCNPTASTYYAESSFFPLWHPLPKFPV